MKIGVIGGGTVGRATARAFVEHVDEVRVYDVVKERRTTDDLDSILETDLVFLCLPTPQKKDSLECNVEIVENFVDAIPTSYRDNSIVLRSTVPIGTTRRLADQYGLTGLVHSPEFLTARCAVTDAHLPSRNIIGYPIDKDRYVDLQYHPVHSLYERRYRGIPVYSMTSDESEAVKLFTNGFFATKIGYFNEIYQLSQNLGLDWGRVMEGVLSDGRIAHSHTQVPGPDKKLGFGGICLPKDLASLKYQLLNNGCGLGVVDAVYEKNREWRASDV